MRTVDCDRVRRATFAGLACGRDASAFAGTWNILLSLHLYEYYRKTGRFLAQLGSTNKHSISKSHVTTWAPGDLSTVGLQLAKIHYQPPTHIVLTSYF